MLANKTIGSLYEEFLREKRTNRRFELAGLYIGYGAYVISLSIVFAFKKEDPLFSAMFFLGLFTRTASLMIGRVYLVPKIFLGLLSNDASERDLAWETIHSHREEIVGRLARNIFGWNDASELYSMDREEMTEFVQDHTRINWRRIGRIFLFFYIPIAIFVTYLTIYAWFS
ncbi:hypothetical protein EHQ53_00905 [Leptospira langatensis]|uniref:Uncharacterized protein n=1 Tax=Leptospira langatensis TaxID=2484983 RepID=A0A5F1ZYA4_9LEPT|nr:hypothetical protein [Leptospira langatensis]TGJ98316.1 hypothetical protein EHO57_17050 [Leptospira langatensis]TGL43230.1 hypothetical protein EHQ53_00905 [Leptospira langatensis]